ncbi:hypothetical protein N9588_01135 [Methylophilaceae bacterium]|jgi:hypothetical protein|nr:hypothetical protein [Methylophilaceae bacterium]
MNLRMIKAGKINSCEVCAKGNYMEWLYIGIGTLLGTSLLGSSFLTNILLGWAIWELRKMRSK